MPKNKFHSEYRCRALFAAVALLIAMIFPLNLAAQGWILPESPQSIPASPAFVLQSQRIEAKVTENIADYRISQVFRNASERAIQGQFYFPLPRGSQVTEFALFADGKRIEGQLLERSEARKIYENLLRKWRDPALLEFLDQDLFRASLFPVPPNGTREIRLHFVQQLARDGDLYVLDYPLFQKRRRSKVLPFNPDAKLIVDLFIHSKHGIQQVYSPSHRFDVVRPDEETARLSFEGRMGDIGQNRLRVYFKPGRDPVGISLLAHREPDKPGFFLLIASPQIEGDFLRAQPKDLVFVLDVSGSMSGDKLKQAKAALRYCLEHLRSGDRFDLVAFSTEPRLFRPNLQPVKAVPAAEAFVDSLEARGGTNIHDALLRALSLNRSADRFFAVVFLTDGLPTVGITEDSEILKAVMQHNRHNVRIFAFGVGYDVNTFLIDQLAEKTNAVADYITPGENIETVVSSFFDKVAEPLLTNVQLQWQGVKVSEVYPKRLPDLFQGTDLVVLGRYRNPGEGFLTLSGRHQEQKFEFSADIRFPEAEEGNAFIAPLWASRKIGFLLDEIRLHGENQELVDEIVRLSKKYGIVTPYTSYLAREEAPLLAQPVPGQPAPSQTPPGGMHPFYQLSPGLIRYSADGGKKGEAAVTASEAIAAFKQMRSLDVIPASKQMMVAGRVFSLRDGVWMQEDLPEGLPVARVAYASDAYFWLVDQFPRLAEILSLGENIRFRFQNVVISVEAEPGEGQVSLSQLKGMLLK